MAKHAQTNKSVLLAASTAIILMLALGLMHRAVLARLATPAGEIHIDPSALDKFPKRIDHWLGTATPLDEKIVRTTSADSLINRQYASEKTSDKVSLYIACGVRTSEIMIHHPEVCYPANGWTLRQRNVIQLSVNDDLKLPCRIFEFSRGTVEQENVTVLHYIVVDGLPYRDISLARSSYWRLTERVDYIAQIQIIYSSKTSTTDDSAGQIVRGFARDSAPAIVELLRSLKTNKPSAEERIDPNESAGVADNG